MADGSNEEGPTYSASENLLTNFVEDGQPQSPLATPSPEILPQVSGICQWNWYECMEENHNASDRSDEEGPAYSAPEDVLMHFEEDGQSSPPTPGVALDIDLSSQVSRDHQCMENPNKSDEEQSAYSSPDNLCEYYMENSPPSLPGMSSDPEIQSQVSTVCQCSCFICMENHDLSNRSDEERPAYSALGDVLMHFVEDGHSPPPMVGVIPNIVTPSMQKYKVSKISDKEGQAHSAPEYLLEYMLEDGHSPPPMPRASSAPVIPSNLSMSDIHDEEGPSYSTPEDMLMHFDEDVHSSPSMPGVTPNIDIPTQVSRTRQRHCFQCMENRNMSYISDEEGQAHSAPEDMLDHLVEDGSSPPPRPGISSDTEIQSQVGQHHFYKCIKNEDVFEVSSEEGPAYSLQDDLPTYLVEDGHSPPALTPPNSELPTWMTRVHICYCDLRSKRQDMFNRSNEEGLSSSEDGSPQMPGTPSNPEIPHQVQRVPHGHYLCLLNHYLSVVEGSACSSPENLDRNLVEDGHKQPSMPEATPQPGDTIPGVDGLSTSSQPMQQVRNGMLHHDNIIIYIRSRLFVDNVRLKFLLVLFSYASHINNSGIWWFRTIWIHFGLQKKY